MASPRLYKQLITSGTGSFVAPAGVKYLVVTGCGGGGGGGGGAASSGRGNTTFAGGGSGGWAAPTATHVVAVNPGQSYPYSIGSGGAGGSGACIANQADGGGTRAGSAGSDGQSTVLGSVTFPGGKGGRGGALVTLSSMTFILGFDCNYGSPPLTLITNNNPLPDQIQNSATLPAFAQGQGISHNVWRAGGQATSGTQYSGQYSISGGGTAGGISNNIYSSAGGGGNGAQGFDGNPFSGGGGPGAYGGGGGGGGGGENWDYNNTHDGSGGGPGGGGFLEISWVA